MLGLFGLFSIIALASYNAGDPSFNLSSNQEPHNLLSYAGSYFADIIYQFIGLGGYIFSVCCIIWSIILFKESHVNRYFLKFISMFFSLSLLSFLFDSIKIELLPSGSGGVVGIYLAYLINSVLILKKYILIVKIILFFLSIILLIYALSLPISMYKNICKKLLCIIGFVGSKIGISKLINKILNRDSDDAYYAADEFTHVGKGPNNSVMKAGKVEDSALEDKKSPGIFARKKRKPKVAPPLINASNIEDFIPSIDLLDDADQQSFKPQSVAQLAEKSEKLVSVLKDFGVKGKILDAREGPVVTMYEFEPAAGTKSSRVIGLADDIARSLSAVSTRISVIPGRNALGIELPNEKRMFFRLKELVQTDEFNNSSLLLPIVLGKDLSGRPMIADLAKMPHLLVAGTTGSGKSVAINTMIMSLLYKYTPEQCRMIMIDPKMLELSAYDNIPHLMTPVVTEPGKAVVALKWAVKEMENRYRLMSHLGVRSIANYNVKIKEAIEDGEVLERKVQTGFDPETGKPIYETMPIEMTKMPFIVVIVDEMADLMLVAGKDIEGSIQRLAQMARAAGIHIIMATQRPSVDVITGVIKANFPSRISFKVTSKIDSRTILGEQGAEQLLGMGDMLHMGSSSRILRVHGPFVDDSEVAKVTSFLRSTGVPEYISAVTENIDEEVDSGSNIDNSGEGADLYSQAVNIVRTERKSSISYIQRCLRIGYNKAANLVEEMERNGVLSEPNHSGKREILLPEDG